MQTPSKHKQDSDAKNIFHYITKYDFCVGCGFCAGFIESSLTMTRTTLGSYAPNLISDLSTSQYNTVVSICPFANNLNETELARMAFGSENNIKHNEAVGYYIQSLAGWVSDEEERLSSTSGGIITWLSKTLLNTNTVQAVACVAPSYADSGPKFKYKLITNAKDLDECRKSRYYPVEVSNILPVIRSFNGSVLFIGLPCFSKAMRLAMHSDPVLREKVKYIIGLFCGHLKTEYFSEYLIRSVGIVDTPVISMDFRKKTPGNKANDYSFEATSLDSDNNVVKRHIPMRKVFANSWTYNLFMLKACEYCDDVVAETSDISVGDAWLPEYNNDYRGTSIILTRNTFLTDLLLSHQSTGKLHLDKIPINKVIQSQLPTLQQRRTGLQYRLYLSQKKGLWHPNKRYPADRNSCSLLYKAVQLLRLKTRSISLDAWHRQRTTSGTLYFKLKLFPWVFLSDFINFIRHLPKRMNSLKHKILSIVSRE